MFQGGTQVDVVERCFVGPDGGNGKVSFSCGHSRLKREVAQADEWRTGCNYHPFPNEDVCNCSRD